MSTTQSDDLRAWTVVGLVLRRELVTRGLSVGYLASTAFLLLVLLGVIVVPTLLSGPTTYRVGVVGAGNEPIVDTAQRLADTQSDPEAPTTVAVRRYPDEAAGRRAVEDGAVAAVLIDGRRIVVERADGFTGNDLLDLLQSAAARQQIETLVGAPTAAAVRAALDDDQLTVTALTGQDAAQTRGRSVIAYGGLVLTYMLILQYGVWTLTGVTEEKANRVIEILLATARPWQLFAGKLAGVALLGLAQFTVVLLTAMVAVRVTGAFELPAIPTDVAGTLLLWVVLGFATYQVLFGAAGALASKSEDAQSVTAPITIVVLVGFFSSFNVLADPTGWIAQVGTFVPVFSPFVVPIRAALGALPAWQAVGAVIVSILSITGLTLLSARVYRGGSLHYAGRLGWLQAVRGADT